MQDDDHHLIELMKRHPNEEEETKKMDDEKDKDLSNEKEKSDKPEEEKENDQSSKDKRDDDDDSYVEDNFKAPDGVDYSAVFNGDFLPIICNDFVTDFLDHPHGVCILDRADAIDLTRNFCHWVASNGLTCARISLNQ